MFFKHLIHLQITERLSLSLNCCGEVSGRRENLSFWLMTFDHIWKKQKTKTELISYTASLSYQRVKFPPFKNNGDNLWGSVGRNDFDFEDKCQFYSDKNNRSNSMHRDVMYSTVGHKCRGGKLLPCAIWNTAEGIHRALPALRKIPDFPLYHGLNGRLWADSPFQSFLSHFGIV